MADYEISVGVKPDYSGLDQLEQRIKNAKHEITVGVNTKGVTTNVKGVASEIQRLTQVGSIQTWAKNNTNATDKFGKSLRNIITEFNDIDKPMSMDRYNQLRKDFQIIKNDAFSEGLLGKSAVDKTMSQIQRLTKADSLQKWADNNTKAMKKYGTEFNSIISRYSDLNNPLRQSESDELLKRAGIIKANSRKEGLLGLTFGDKMKNAWSKFGQWGLATASITTVTRQVSKAMSEIVDIDSILTEISKTSDLTDAQLKQLGNSSFGAASKYGKSASDYLTSVQEMSRSGFYGKKAEGMAEQALLAQAAGDLTADSANKYILATNAAYKYNGEINKINDALDGQNMITNRNSVSMADMTEAMTHAANVASSYNVSIEDLSAMIGTMEATTKAGGGEVGNAIKALLINLQNVGSNKIRGTLARAGAPMTEFINGVEKNRNPIDILRDLAKTFNTLDDDDTMRAEILTNIGQKYHANKLAAFLENIDLFDKMLVDYSEGDGSAEIEAMKSANNVQGRLNALNNTWTASIESLVNSDMMKGAINLANGLLGGVGNIFKVADTFGGSFGGIGLGAGLYFGLANKGFIKTQQDDYGYNLGFKSPFKKDKNGVSDFRANRNAGQGLFYSLFQSDKINQKDVGYIKQYANAVDGGARYMKDASRAAKKYVLEAKKSGKSKQEILAGLEEMPKAFSFKSIGLGLLRTVGSTALGMAASGIVNLISQGVTKVVNHRTDTIAAGEQARNTIDNIYGEYIQKKDSAESLADTIAKYAPRVSGLGTYGQGMGSLSKAEYDEFINASNSLAQLFPQLITGTDKSGNAILDISANTVRGTINRAIQNSAASTHEDIADNMSDVWKEYALEAYGETDWSGQATTNKFLDGLDDKVRINDKASIDASKIRDALKSGKPMFDFKDIGYDIRKVLKTDLREKLGNELYDKIYTPASNPRNDSVSKTENLSFDDLSDSEKDKVLEALGSMSTEYASDAKTYEAKKVQKDKVMAGYIDKFIQGSPDFFQLPEEYQDFYTDFLYNGDWMGYIPDDKRHKWEDVEQWLNDDLFTGLSAYENYNSLLPKILEGTASTEDLSKLLPLTMGRNDPTSVYLRSMINRNLQNNQNRTILSSNLSPLTDDYQSFVDSLSDEELEASVKIVAEKDGMIDSLSEFEFELGKITGDFSRTTRKEAEDLLDEKIEEYKKTNRVLEDLNVNDENYEFHRDNLLAHRDAIASDISSLEGIIRETKSLEYSYSRWQESLETENSGVEYDVIGEGIKTAKELRKAGLIGTDDFQTFAQLISPDNLSDADAYTTMLAFDKALPQVEKYFNTGKDGCVKLLKEMKKLNKETDKFAKYDSETGLWSTNFNAEDIEETLGLSQPVAEAVLQKMEEYGYNVIKSPVKSSLDDLRSDFDKNLEIIQEQFEGTEFEIDISPRDKFSNDVDYLKEKIGSLKLAYDSMFEKDGEGNVTSNVLPEVSGESLAATQGVLAELIRQKSEIEMEPIKLSFTYEEAESPKEKAAVFTEELKAAMTDRDVADFLNLDTTELDAKIQEISTKLSGLFTGEDGQSLAASLGFTPEMMSSLTSLSKIDLSPLTKGMNVDLFETQLETIKKSIGAVTETIKVDAELTDGAADSIKNALPKDHTITVQYDDPGFTPGTSAPLIVPVIYQPQGDVPEGVIVPVTDPPSKPKSKPKPNPDDNLPQARADGNATPSDMEKALGGELGAELLVRDGRCHLIGQDGAEFFDYKKGDIIFNAEQTKQLLNSGKISLGNKRGRAFADGTGNNSDPSTNKKVETLPDGTKIEYTDQYGNYLSSPNIYNQNSVSSAVLGRILNDFLDKASRWYKISENDMQYINELKEGLNTKAQNEDDKITIADKIEDAYKNYAQNRIDDLEHENTLLESLSGNEGKIIDNLKSIQNITHEEAERYRQYLRDQGVSEEEIAKNSYIQEMQSDWLDTLQKIADVSQKLFEGRIDDLEHENEMLSNLRGTEKTRIDNLTKMRDAQHEEAERYRQYLRERGLSEEEIAKDDYVQERQADWWKYQNEILDMKLDNSEGWIKDRNDFNDWALFGDSEIDAWERTVEWLKRDYPESIEKIKDAEKSLFKARKEEFKNASDFALDYLDSQKEILQSHYDVTNAITEARYEIEKELEVSKTMHEYLDEETRKLLFNQEDFNKLNSELNKIESKSLKLKADYEKALENSTLETVESITSEYKMQYETLMKSYEIAKADLEVAKKKAQLNNVLNERNVRMFINGSWQWVANTEDVSTAKSELADAEYAQKIAKAGLTQQESIDELTKRQDKVSEVIKKFENGVISLDEAVGLASGAIANLPKALKKMLGKSTGNAVKSNDGVWYDSSVDYAAKIHSASSLSEALRYNEQRNAKIKEEGRSEAAYSTSYIESLFANKNASGTGYTKGGWTLLGEKEAEMYINANGHLIPINRPTVGNIEAGGVVFNQKQMDSVRKIWDWANLGVSNLGGLYTAPERQSVNNIDNRIIINGMTVDGGSSDGQALIDAMRRYVGNH